MWWTMPLSHLAVFLAEIEPLQAEESLRRINEIRLAQADPKDNKAKMIMHSWENQAQRADRIIESERPKPSRQEYFRHAQGGGHQASVAPPHNPITSAKGMDSWPRF